jgi:hypothetical protein
MKFKKTLWWITDNIITYENIFYLMMFMAAYKGKYDFMILFAVFGCSETIVRRIKEERIS